MAPISTAEPFPQVATIFFIFILLFVSNFRNLNTLSLNQHHRGQKKLSNRYMEIQKFTHQTSPYVYFKLGYSVSLFEKKKIFRLWVSVSFQYIYWNSSTFWQFLYSSLLILNFTHWQLGSIIICQCGKCFACIGKNDIAPYAKYELFWMNFNTEQIRQQVLRD